MRPVLIASLAATLLLANTGAAVAGDEAAIVLPDSERLAPVRPALQAVVDDARRESLPAELLLSKIREGLAKNVPAERILDAVRAQAQNLTRAQRLLRASGRAAGSPALLRAIAEGEAAGVEAALLAPLTQAPGNDAELARAVDAVTELSLRGYPRRPAAEVVQQVLVSDPTAVARVPHGLEELRAAAGLTRIDAVDALGRSLSSGAATFDLALKTAVSLATNNAEAAGKRQVRGRGRAGDSGAGRKDHGHGHH